MSILFTASEVLNMGVEIEKNGMDFYNAMANRTEDESAKELFTFLAGEEVKHKGTFQAMLKNLSKLELTASEEEEYNNYLGALTSSRVFKSNDNAEELASSLTTLQAIDMAIEAEKDSILFYYELMEQALDGEKGDIERVIKEEKAHYGKLMNLKEKISG